MCPLSGVELSRWTKAQTVPISRFRTLALPKEIERWSLTTMRQRLVKIGAKMVGHGRNVIFHLAEVAVPRSLFRELPWPIDELPRRTAAAWTKGIDGEKNGTREVAGWGEK